MRSGELRQRIGIERQQTWSDQWGRQSAWRNFATVWASVTAKNGSETFSTTAKQVNAAVVYEVKMRYRSDINSECRFNHHGKLLDVVSVIDPSGRRQELVVTCVLHGDGCAVAA